MPHKDEDERRRVNRESKRRAREANREGEAEKNRRWRFQREYGITIEEYDERRAAQDYRCAICQRHEDELPRHLGRPTTDGLQVLGRALVVDHCHRTGAVRKLLCHRCNQGIGHFEEDPERLEAAARYVRESCQGGISG
jgi:recombination endonuclease VII